MSDTTPQRIALEDMDRDTLSDLENHLLDLWEEDDVLIDLQVERRFGGLLCIAWDILNERAAFKFIVEGVETLSTLSEKLRRYLRDERQRFREREIDRQVAEGKGEVTAMTEASHLADTMLADWVDVFVCESDMSDAQRLNDLLGYYTPQVILHLVPDAWINKADAGNTPALRTGEDQ